MSVLFYLYVRVLFGDLVAQNFLFFIRYSKLILDNAGFAVGWKLEFRDLLGILQFFKLIRERGADVLELESYFCV